MTIELTPLALTLVPAVVAVVEAVKMAGLPAKYASLLSLVLGVAAAFTLLEGAVVAHVTQGILIGLSASGAYSGGRAVLQ